MSIDETQRDLLLDSLQSLETGIKYLDEAIAKFDAQRAEFVEKRDSALSTLVALRAKLGTTPVIQ